MIFSERTEKYIEVISRQMESIGVLEEADKENLILLKYQVELYYRALDEIDTNGLIIDGARGKTQNPAFAIERSAIQNITSLLRELSLSARQRRFLTKDAIIQEPDALDAFLDKMNQE